MRRTFLQAFILFIGLASICFITIYFLKYPGAELSLDKNGNLGGFIGGVTAPILGLVSSIFLYLTLTKQTESNREQFLKNESDVIFLLLNQLEIELSTIYTKYKKTTYTKNGKEERELKMQGMEALNEFALSIRFEYDLSDVKYKFNDHFQSSQLLLLIRSFKLAHERILISNLNDKMKTMFLQKLEAFFDCRLKYATQSITEAIEPFKNYQDEVWEEVKTFHNKFSKRVG